MSETTQGFEEALDKQSEGLRLWLTSMKNELADEFNKLPEAQRQGSEIAERYNAWLSNCRALTPIPSLGFAAKYDTEKHKLLRAEAARIQELIKTSLPNE